jgi:hypothetical protein
MNVYPMGLSNKKMHWEKYNHELVNQGSLTVYLGDDLASMWTSNEGAAAHWGRSTVYPDRVVQLGLLPQQIYRLPLRQTVGLMRSFLTLSGVALEVPDPSTLCRLRRDLTMPHWPKGDSCIVIDSTGFQIRGPNCQIHDAEAFDSLLATADLAAAQEVIGDGAYDLRCYYAGARRRRLRLITPRRIGAVLHREPGSLQRDGAIREVRLLGNANWKRSHHYGRRSLAEAAMHRIKAAFGPSLRSRLWSNQQKEALLRVDILNSWRTPKRIPCS